MLMIRFGRLFDLADNKIVILGGEEYGEVWNWRQMLLAWEEEQVRECNDLLINNVLQPHVHDS
jgi:hypothetical protein